MSLANVYSCFGSISNAFYLYTVTVRACSSTPYCAHVHLTRSCVYHVRLSAPCTRTQDGDFFLNLRLTLVDPRGVPGMHIPPGGPNSFIFMQFSAKNWKIIVILGVGAPPWGKSWIRHWLSLEPVGIGIYSKIAGGRSLFLSKILPYSNLPVLISFTSKMSICIFFNRSHDWISHANILQK